MPEWRIRRYEPRDCADVWRLHREGVEQTRTAATELAGYEDDLRDVEASYLGDGSNFWVAELPGGDLIGITAIQRTDGKTGRLRRMRVTTAWRGRGVARDLLETAVAFCREQGYARVILDTTSQQTDAHRLYERYGFRKLGERMLGPYLVFDYELRLS
jgi:GNAT superfamily N-acetyltransferase